MRKTAYELRISDWSSDVCSSDLDQARNRFFFLDRARQWHRQFGALANIAQIDADSHIHGRLAIPFRSQDGPALGKQFVDRLPDKRRADRGQGAQYRFDEMMRSEEHTSELQSLMRISYAVFCLKTKIRTLTKIIQ